MLAVQPQSSIPPPQGNGSTVEQLLGAGGGILGPVLRTMDLPRLRRVEMESSARPPNVSTAKGLCVRIRIRWAGTSFRAHVHV